MIGARVREEILAECARLFSQNSDDCNKYLKAVGAPFFDPDLFTGHGMNADAIVRQLRQSEEWEQLGTAHTAAIAQAKAGKFVVAGMTSRELKSNHGHVAVVVGDDGRLSGTVLVPICYAGSLSPTARVQRKRVSETFGAQVARDNRISYFCREVETVPAIDAVSRLADQLRGVVVLADELPRIRMAGVASPLPKGMTRTRRTKRISGKATKGKRPTKHE